MKRRRGLAVVGSVLIGLVVFWWLGGSSDLAPSSRHDKARSSGSEPSAEAEPMKTHTSSGRRAVPVTPVTDAGAPAPHGDEPTGDDEPVWTVSCAVTLDAPFEGEVVFREYVPLEQGIMPVKVPARIDHGTLRLAASDATHRGSVKIPGYPDFSWEPDEDGGCPTVSLQVVSGVVGTVTPSWGSVRVSACHSRRDADDDGSFYIPASPGSCSVQATRSDPGGIVVRGEEVVVEVVDGEDTVVNLTLPDEVWGTIGMTLRRIDGQDVVEVDAVRPGSVADSAGIQSADRIVSINGESPVECDRGWLFNCLHGPMNTWVVLEFEDGQVLELERDVLVDEVLE